MKRPTKKFVKLGISLMFALTTGAPAFAKEAPLTCEGIPQKCADMAGDQNTVNSIGAGLATADKEGIHETGNSSGAAYNAGGAGFESVLASCQSLEKKCVSVCKTNGKPDPDKATKCQNKIEGYIGEIAGAKNGLNGAGAQSQQTAQAAGGQQPQNPPQSSGGGMGSMGAGLIGALAGGVLGYMMGKKAGKKEAEKDKAKDADGALQANGTIDCSKDDAYQYQDCNEYLSGICSTEIKSGTYATDAKCMNFGNRFCGSGGSAAAPTLPPVVPVGVPVDGTAPIASSATPPPGVVGEGMGTPMCQSVMAFNYCKVAGRDQCPSCLQMARNQSQACMTDPALCLAQNSPGQMDAAKASCPTDPAFSNPAYVAGGGAIATQLNTSGAPIPAVVLPQTVNSASASGAVTPSTGLSVASVASGSADGAVRESATIAGADGGGSAGNSSFTAQSVSGHSEVAGSGGGDGGALAHSTGRSPASDIQGQFGPSLFAMGTQAVRNRCQAGKLNNCP